MEHLTHHQFETLVQNGQDPYDEELRKFLLDLKSKNLQKSPIKSLHMNKVT